MRGKLARESRGTIDRRNSDIFIRSKTDGVPKGSGLVFAHFSVYDQDSLVFVSAKPRIEIFYAGNNADLSLFSL